MSSYHDSAKWKYVQGRKCFVTFAVSDISDEQHKNIYCRKYKRKIKIWLFPSFVKKKTLGISFVKSSWENFPAWIIKITVLSGKSSFHVFVFSRIAVKKAITLCRKWANQRIRMLQISSSLWTKGLIT